MAKYKNQRLFTLNNPYSPRLCPELAKEIGLNESIMLLQIEFWLATQGEERDDGNLWLRKTIREIQIEFPYWGTGTIGRILEALIAKGFIIAAGLDDGPGRSGRWMRFDFERLSTLQSIRVLSHSGKTVFPNIEDSVPDGDIRPYIDLKEQDHGKLSPVSNVTAHVLKRSRPVSNGRPKKQTPPEKTLLPKDFVIEANGETARFLRSRAPDVPLSDAFATWKDGRIADAKESADWEADFRRYCMTWQANYNDKQKRYEQRAS